MTKEEIIIKYEEKISFTDKCIDNMTVHRNEIGRMMNGTINYNGWVYV